MEFRPSFHPGGDLSAGPSSPPLLAVTGAAASVAAGVSADGTGGVTASWVGRDAPQQQHERREPGRGSTVSGLNGTGKAAAAAVAAAGGRGGRGGRPPRSAAAAPLSRMEAAVANECLVSLLAMQGTVSRLATQPQVRAALRREGFPDVTDALGLLKDADALRGCGVRDRRWRGRRGAALVRARAEDSLFARLPPELFGHVLVFLSS